MEPMTSTALPEIIMVDAATSLQKTGASHAATAIDLILANKTYLREWLPWVDYMETEADFVDYGERCEKQWAAGTDYGFTIFYNEEIAGRIGVHYINNQNKCGAIGYWLGKNFNGKGIVTKSVTAIIQHSFNALLLNRLELKCATGNYKSAAVAERLHFIKEGVLREAEWVNGHALDLNLYALLKKDWQPT